MSLQLKCDAPDHTEPHHIGDDEEVIEVLVSDGFAGPIGHRHYAPDCFTTRMHRPAPGQLITIQHYHRAENLVSPAAMLGL